MYNGRLRPFFYFTFDIEHLEFSGPLLGTNAPPTPRLSHITSILLFGILDLFLLHFVAACLVSIIHGWAWFSSLISSSSLFSLGKRVASPFNPRLGVETVQVACTTLSFAIRAY